MKSRYDVIVIGSGLAGLFCALTLQQKGCKVLILERLSRVGGLCGTALIDGYEFCIACYHFGTGIQRELKKLDVAIEFHAPKTVFRFDGAVYQFPLGLKGALKLLPYAFDLLRLATAFRRNGCRYYSELIESCVRSRRLQRILRCLSYLFCYPADQLPIVAMKNAFSKKYHYGYEKLVAPTQGPQYLVDRLVERFLLLGGTLQRETQCETVNAGLHGRSVVTNRGVYESQYVVSSQLPPFGPDSGITTNGLAASFLLLAVKKSFPYPANVSTIAYLPSTHCPEFMEQINAGVMPTHFGFHIAKVDLPEQPQYFTLNVSFFLPRGMNGPDAGRKKAIEIYLLDHLEKMLPGIHQALLYKKFLSADDFTALYLLSSQPEVFMFKPGQKKHPGYDPQSDIYYVGTAVEPEGGQSGAAILSGIFAAQKIIARRTDSSGKRINQS